METNTIPEIKFKLKTKVIKCMQDILERFAKRSTTINFSIFTR